MDLGSRLYVGEHSTLHSVRFSLHFSSGEHKQQFDHTIYHNEL